MAWLKGEQMNNSAQGQGTGYQHVILFVSVIAILNVEINYVCADFIGDSITKITSNKGRGPSQISGE